MNGFHGIKIERLKLFLLLYADDIVLFSDCEKGLQDRLNSLYTYCNKWKLVVNIKKTKVTIFRKGGIIRRNVSFTFDNETVEIVKSFTYLGIIFTTGGSFQSTFDSLSGQALKGIFKLKSCFRNFQNISISHKMSLFYKLIIPILSYGSEVWCKIRSCTYAVLQTNARSKKSNTE